MSDPTRISHYPRTDGKLPRGARWVGRGSRWGNPWPVPEYPLDEAIDLYRHFAVLVHSRYPGWLDPLRDATALACACPLDQQCHAVILLDLIAATNQPEGNTK